MNAGNSSKRSSQLLGPIKGRPKLCFPLEPHRTPLNVPALREPGRGLALGSVEAS